MLHGRRAKPPLSTDEPAALSTEGGAGAGAGFDVNNNTLPLRVSPLKDASRKLRHNNTNGDYSGEGVPGEMAGEREGDREGDGLDEKRFDHSGAGADPAQTLVVVEGMTAMIKEALARPGGGEGTCFAYLVLPITVVAPFHAGTHTTSVKMYGTVSSGMKRDQVVCYEAGSLQILVIRQIYYGP